MDELFSVDNLHKSFGPLEVLKGVSLQVSKGERIAVIGPSGCGKTTMLRCMNFLEIGDRGILTFDGNCYDLELVRDRLGSRSMERELCTIRTDIAMVFQHFNLFHHLTALQNVVEAPIHVRKMPRDDAVELGRRLLADVDLSDKEDSYPVNLSGGQKQRVAIARALAMRPKMVLFDEVTSALDAELIGEVLLVMRKLAEEGLTMVIVTHELDFARQVADRILFVDYGRIVEEGPPAVMLEAPQHERTRRFLRAVLEKEVFEA